MAGRFRILLIYSGVLLGIFYCAKSEVPPITGQCDSLKYGSNSQKDVHGKDKTGEEPGRASSSCRVNVDDKAVEETELPKLRHSVQTWLSIAIVSMLVDDVNWLLLSMQSATCIVEVLSLSESKLPTACSHTAEIRSCLQELLGAAECLPVWSTHKDEMYRPEEIFENGFRAFCSPELSPRITTANSYIASGGVQALKRCKEEQGAELRERVQLCGAELGVKLNFDGGDICGRLEMVENCLLSSLEVCKDSDLAIKTAEHCMDVVLGLALKCPNHPNF